MTTIDRLGSETVRVHARRAGGRAGPHGPDADPVGRNPIRIALDLVLPRTCPGCGGPQSWCPGCAATLGSRPRLVVWPDATRDGAGDLVLPPARALARYAGPVRAAVIAGKERGRTDLPVFIGQAVGAGLLRLRRISVIPEVVWIVPAPSRRSAVRRRGGDPVAVMARSAAASMAAAGVACGVAPCLYTAGGARDSVGLDVQARAENLAGRVRFRSAGAPPDGVVVVLLDDVLTTGSTLMAATRALSVTGIEVSTAFAVASVAPWYSGRR